MPAESISSSDVIDSLSASSLLTTVPCTTITELQKPSINYSTPNRFQHEIIGWSPDVGNVRRFAAGDCHNVSSTPKLMNIRGKTSSIYMMNYEKRSPKIQSMQMQEAEPPSGYAIPVKAAAASSTSNDGPSKIFSPPIPLYHLRSNPIHRPTFYKCVFQSTEKLDCNDIEKAIWQLPNASPRISVLHLSCNAGAVTAVNLATGRCVRKTLSSTSVATQLREIEPPSLADESVRMMKLRSKWSSTQMIATSPPSRTPESQISEYGNQYEEAWSEVNEELEHLQQMFGGDNNHHNIPIYRSDDEIEYQQEILRNFAPHIVTSQSYPEHSIGTEIYEEEDESEMQLIPPSEPSEFEKNIHFRRSFEKVFRGRYEHDGPIDRWLKTMADETIVNNPQVFCRDHHDTISEASEDEEEDRVLQILSTCENVLKQLENITAPMKSPIVQQQRCAVSECDCGDSMSTPCVASCSSGVEESFTLIRSHRRL